MSERLVSVDELVTVDDIAKMLRMSLNATSNIVRGRDGRHKLKFPRPLVGRGTRAVWLSEDVIEWYEKTAPTTEQARRRAAKAASMTYRNNNWRKSA